MRGALYHSIAIDSNERRLPWRQLDKRGTGWHRPPPRNAPAQGTPLMTTAASPSPAVRAEVPNNLAAFWLPFTPNRAFKKRPRLISRSKDMHYFTPEGREILDAS